MKYTSLLCRNPNGKEARGDQLPFPDRLNSTDSSGSSSHLVLLVKRCMIGLSGGAHHGTPLGTGHDHRLTRKVICVYIPRTRISGVVISYLEYTVQ